MFRRKQTGDDIEARVTGPVQGQVAIGREIAQHQSAGAMTVQVTQDERAQLRQAFADLRAQVAADAPGEHRAAALERVDELEEATTAGPPDLTTIAYVRGWFARRLPGLAGTVVGILVNPIVGKLVASAGDAAVEQLRQLTGDG
jgi:hypothetical protein